MNIVEDTIQASLIENGVLVMLHNLNLKSENTIPVVEITVEKLPTTLFEGRSYSDNAVLFDSETDIMRNLAAKAEALLPLPEHERIGKVYELLRETLQFPHEEVIEALSKTDPELAAYLRWLDDTHKFNIIPNVPLSKVIEKGYAACRHFSVAYIWLAQKAGLKAALLASRGGIIKNIRRSDTGKKLFWSTDIGMRVAPHTWVEVNTSDGRWVPMNPTMGLRGDSPEGFAMFKEANFLASGNEALSIDIEPYGIFDAHMTPIVFKPGEAVALGTIHLRQRSALPEDVRMVKIHIMPNTPFCDLNLKITHAKIL